MFSEVDEVKLAVESQRNAERLSLTVELSPRVLRVYRVWQKQPELAAKKQQHNLHITS